MEVKIRYEYDLACFCACNSKYWHFYQECQKSDSVCFEESVNNRTKKTYYRKMVVQLKYDDKVYKA